MDWVPGMSCVILLLHSPGGGFHIIVLIGAVPLHCLLVTLNTFI